MTTGPRRVIYGNVPNDGLVSNLPGDCCVEVACLVSDLGLRPVRYGSLQPACAFLNNVQINVQRLAVPAAHSTAIVPLAYAAVALDTLDSCLAHPPTKSVRWSTGYSRRNARGSERSPSRYGEAEKPQPPARTASPGGRSRLSIWPVGSAVPDDE